MKSFAFAYIIVPVPNPRRIYALPLGALVLIAFSIFLSACTTPPVTAPAAISLSEDLRFNWVPPNLGHKMEIFISAGRYTRSAEQWDAIYYESEDGFVSRAYVGLPAEKVKGGIGYFKQKRRYFVWELAPSVVAQTPWVLISNMGEKGPLVQIYLGQVPKELEPRLRLEN